MKKVDVICLYLGTPNLESLNRFVLRVSWAIVALLNDINGANPPAESHHFPFLIPYASSNAE